VIVATDLARVLRYMGMTSEPEVWFDGIGWIPFEPTPQRTLPLDPAQGSSLDALRIMPVT
jgi:hypothetical protein